MLSVVIPVYNEAQSLAILHGELDEVARAEDYEMEIILVDDGSTDDSWRVIEDLAKKDSRVRGVRFRRNFGKAAALCAGFAAATGDLVMTLDADLQDNPSEIPLFLAAIDRELDVVSGWKRQRHDPWHKVVASRIFNRLVSMVTGVKLHDHNCGMKCYRRDVLREVRLYGELHRFVPVLAAARGFQVGEVVIRHRPRRFGCSKYGVQRFVKGFLDLLTVRFLTGFGHRPQHVLGTIGLVCFFVGFVALAYVACETVLVNWLQTPGLGWIDLNRAFIGSLAMVLLGAQLMSLGLVAELIIAYHDRATESYSVAEMIGMPGDQWIVTPQGQAPSVTTAADGSSLAGQARSRAS
jgi:dolichol-phosphate mannosyltransferase